MKKRLQVDHRMLVRMLDIYSGASIADKCFAVDTIRCNNVEYVIIGISYFDNGKKRVCAQSVVDLGIYKDNLTPLKYADHWMEVDSGNRKREYTGMLISCKGRKLVFMGEPVEFECTHTVEQLFLF